MELNTELDVIGWNLMNGMKIRVLGFAQVLENIGFTQNWMHRVAILRLPPSDNTIVTVLCVLQ